MAPCNSISMNDSTSEHTPRFYTVREAAKILRLDPATLYRAIREDAFPAIKIRTRYIVPADAIERMAAEAAETGSTVDIGRMVAERRTLREIARLT
jgi:excisionase family DNA binding protein